VAHRVVRATARALVGLVIFALILVGLGILVIETSWAKNRIRELLVRQANEYLTATLTIGRLEGSVLRGIRLGDIQLSRRDGRILVRVDEIALSYSLRELFQSGTVIRRVRLTRPHVSIARQSDGRWDIAAIVKRERQEGRQTGPGRPIEVQAIEIEDGRVELGDPLDFGAAHVPTDFQSLNAVLAFTYYPVRWRLDFTRVSWIGRAPDLSMSRLSGALGNGPAGWFFDALSVETPRSAFVLGGRVVRSDKPTELALTVRAARFAFQEWSGVLRGLKNIAVESSFDTTLNGPLSQLATDLRLQGTGGSVSGRLILDTTVPGWRASGAVDVGRLNLARWLNNDKRPSDISGHVRFDLALELGRHFPRGVYRFDGPHAMYMGYAADRVTAEGRITDAAVLIAGASGTAYGAGVTTHDGSIGIDSPFPYRFQGTLAQIDLRNVPPAIPVPRVESRLTFDYDVSGQFSQPFIAGQARFAPSTFLGAAIGDGTVGTIDTAQQPFVFSGDGEISNANTRRFGDGLEVAWLQDPRYAGTIAGRFHVHGQGSDRATLTLSAGGRLTRGDLFRGTLTDADVTLDLAHGTLRASYAGQFAGIDPAIPFADSRWQASLTGTGTVAVTARDLLTRTVSLDDYDVSGSLTLRTSIARRLSVDRATVDGALRSSQLAIARLDVSGAALEGHGSGSIALDDRQASSFTYQVTRADLGQLQAITGRSASGLASTSGRVTGPWSALQATGDGAVAQLDAFGVTALEASGHYDVRFPATDVTRAIATVDGRATFITVAGQRIQQVSGTVALDAQRLRVDLQVLQAERRNGSIAGAGLLRLDDRSVDISELAIGLGRSPWRLQADHPVTVHWDDASVSTTPATFAGGNDDERLSIAGNWRRDGAGALRVTAVHVSLDALQSVFERPALYGGVLDLDATIRGTRDHPSATATLSVTGGRVDRVSYQTFGGRVDYADRNFTVNLRLDQAPGIWITAVGTVPAALVDRSLPEQPLDVSIKSSGVGLGLLEGLTDAVRRVSGELVVDVRAVGTSHDPHFTGTVSIDRAAFEVAASGVRYQNGRVSVTLTTDRIAVDAFRIEDSAGRPLEVRGSLGTHELRVGALEIEINARRFEVLRNELGRIDLDAALQLRGRFEAPLLTGELTVNAGDLKVDEILQRALFQPYSTQEAAIADVATATAVGTWQLLGLNLTLHVPNTLRLTGDNVQLTPGTPIGLGDINLRVAGDLYLYKDAGQPLYVTGGFDSVSGTYAFQSRRFDVDPSSSIVFRGDLSPELYVGVTRTISGVVTRVGVIGPLKQPELRLSSVPPLDESDILSLIVFNTSTNELTAQQQQDLVVRAGALAAGFLAAPIVSAISREIGLDILEIDPGSDLVGDVGAKLTVGQEIAPGLVARFSRQFGSEPYDEATVEYYLSRIIRLRATFSDAQTLSARSPFRRIERAGIDLLFFFSF
jgi:autotransporter translocation and assembly factor TamB